MRTDILQFYYKSISFQNESLMRLLWNMDIVILSLDERDQIGEKHTCFHGISSSKPEIIDNLWDFVCP